MKQFRPKDGLIACPNCDGLHDAAIPDGEKRLACGRCHTVLIAPRRHAGLKIILLAVASLILVWGAVTLPFIKIRRFGLSSEATLVEMVLSFDGPLRILSVLVIALVLVLPLARVVLSLYVLVPLVMDRRPLPYALRAFAWFEKLRPWSMAEIFGLGCGVALIKIVDLAHVTLGSAFWMFLGLVILIIIQNSLMCRWSVWDALER